jgi:hypothetical protein
LPQDASNREIQAVWATAKAVRCGLFITEFAGIVAGPGSGKRQYVTREFLSAVWMMVCRIRWLPHAAAATTTDAVAASTQRDFVAFGC